MLTLQLPTKTPIIKHFPSQFSKSLLTNINDSENQQCLLFTQNCNSQIIKVKVKKKSTQKKHTYMYDRWLASDKARHQCQTRWQHQCRWPARWEAEVGGGPAPGWTCGSWTWPPASGSLWRWHRSHSEPSPAAWPGCSSGGSHQSPSLCPRECAWKTQVSLSSTRTATVKTWIRLSSTRIATIN